MQRILFVGNDTERTANLIVCLEAAGCVVGRAAGVDELLERRYDTPAWDLIVADGAPGVDVDVLLRLARAAHQHRYDETMIRELLATSPDHISFKDLDGRFTRISASVARMFGLEKPDDALGKSDFDFYPEEQARRFRDEEQRMTRGGPPVINRLSDHSYPDGRVIRGLVTKMPLRDADGTVIGTYGVGRDVTDLMEAEERVRALLDEKEILLREIHHRVKNDFGMIRSLLLLEAGHAANPEAAGALREAASRVAVMARTYDQMDIRGSASAVLLRPLIEELLRDAAESVAAQVSIETLVDDTEVPPRVAVALGIVLNELVTNAVKYAFGESEHPTLEVRVHCCAEGRLRVRVADNGRGFDSTVTSGSKRGHGLTIVEALLRQHGGSLALANECGAVVEFSLSAE